VSWVNRLGVDLSDVLALAGAVALEYGLACWWSPAAWIVGGCLAIAVAVAPDLRRKGNR
jgi:hypothetical protein